MGWLEGGRIEVGGRLGRLRICRGQVAVTGFGLRERWRAGSIAGAGARGRQRVGRVALGALVGRSQSGSNLGSATGSHGF